MNFITMNMVTMFYLIASVCFIQALKGLSSPATARKGNAFGMTAQLGIDAPNGRVILGFELEHSSAVLN